MKRRPPGRARGEEPSDVGAKSSTLPAVLAPERVGSYPAVAGAGGGYVWGEYGHVREERMAEWPVEFLRRPPRGSDTLRRFFAPNAPANRVDIIRGLAEWPD